MPPGKSKVAIIAASQAASSSVARNFESRGYCRLEDVFAPYAREFGLPMKALFYPWVAASKFTISDFGDDASGVFGRFFDYLESLTTGDFSIEIPESKLRVLSSDIDHADRTPMILDLLEARGYELVHLP